MTAVEPWPLLALVALGALHGVNPAMGWLFAVALGLQERSVRAVWRALPPLALGHALSVAAMVAAVVLAGRVVPPVMLRAAIAAVLIGAGVHRLVRGHRGRVYGGMRVNQRDLVIWSFLMASGHGAGLMVLPFVTSDAGSHDHATHLHGAGPDALLAGVLGGQAAGLTASLLHTLSYLLVTGLLAVVVYQRAGVRLLRTAWINLDIIWAGALIVTGAVVLVQLL